MFVLSEIFDTVEIRASAINREEEIMVKLNEKYKNKLDDDLGLCIYVDKVLEVEEYEIRSEILITYLKFSLISFRFYSDEICFGKILGQDEEKILVGNSIFNHYECQALDLFENCEFESNEKINVWVWNYKGNRLVFRTGDKVLFRIKSYRPEDSHVEIYMNEQGLGPRIWWE